MNEQGPSKYRLQFGKRLKAVRSPLMSQEEFAEKMELEGGQSFISKVERGERMLSMENVIRAADVLGVHPAILLSDEELTDDQLETVINLFKIFNKGTRSQFEAIRDLLRTYAA